MPDFQEDNSLVFLTSLTEPALTLYIHLDLSKVKAWDDLATYYISHYKYHIDVAHIL